MNPAIGAAPIIHASVLTFLRSYAEKAGIKTTEKKIQESMGDMLLVEGEILPLGVKTYAVARDTELNKLLRKTFDLPEPLDLIKILSEAAIQQIDTCVIQWYETCCVDYPGKQHLYLDNRIERGDCVH